MKYFILILSVISFHPSFAQRSNIANINTLALWELMPEKKAADSNIAELNKQYSEVYSKMAQEIEVKLLSYQGDETALPAIKADRATEIQNLQIRLETFKKEAEKDLATKREALLAPIRNKMQTAIDAVAKKNKYDYVLDSSFGNIIYTKNASDDILELVKKELGL